MEPEAKNNLSIPFIKDVMIHLGWFFFPFSILVIVGASNAVNLTDGLDGLAASLGIFILTAFSIIFYTNGKYFASSWKS